ncbi:MAG TPA: hypothetical protein ENH13_05145 [Euryarchaeota archaeon]|nr:hypothetical protein BMS3Bbin16_00814 [archaeon BMS3Bbin16]HDH28499.1 hypothetical protein [Euryarchaeota archaeon]
MKGVFVVLLLLIVIAGSGCLGSDGSGGEVQTSSGIVEATVPAQTPIQTPAATNQPPDVSTTTTTMTPLPPEPVLIDESSTDYTDLLDEKYQTCLKCHGDVKVFHTAEIISEIDRSKGLNPRLCIVCHGTKVHKIHWDMVNDKYIACGTCHWQNGEFVKPATPPGKLVVCELCHAGGNYVKIHIEGKVLEGAPLDAEWIRKGTSHQCDTCHIGDYKTIHYSPLSSWNEGINTAVKEAVENPPDPLNISYL